MPWPQPSMEPHCPSSPCHRGSRSGPGVPNDIIVTRKVAGPVSRRPAPCCRACCGPPGRASPSSARKRPRAGRQGLLLAPLRVLLPRCTVASLVGLPTAPACLVCHQRRPCPVASPRDWHALLQAVLAAAHLRPRGSVLAPSAPHQLGAPRPCCAAGCGPARSAKCSGEAFLLCFLFCLFLVSPSFFFPFLFISGEPCLPCLMRPPPPPPPPLLQRPPPSYCCSRCSV